MSQDTYIRFRKSTIWLMYLAITVVTTTITIMALLDPNDMANLGVTAAMVLVGGFFLSVAGFGIYDTWKSDWKDTNPVRLDCALGLFALVVFCLATLGALGFGVFAVWAWM